jgi:aquaporin Z
MLSYFVEFIGTFIFLSVIIITGNPLAIGLALASVIWFGGKVSGGHFNPAVNIMMLMNKKMDIMEFVGQTIAQILGAIAAFYYYKSIK